MLEWLDSLLTFSTDFYFLRYLTVCVIIIISVSLAYGLIISMIGSIFNRP